jgi:hypothetical protein
MDKHLMPGCRSGSQAQEPKPSSEPVWDVQDILAERTSLMEENEELVVWKPSLEPIRNVCADGPAMNRFRASRFLGVALGYAAGFKSSATSGERRLKEQLVALKQQSTASGRLLTSYLIFGKPLAHAFLEIRLRFHL